MSQAVETPEEAQSLREIQMEANRQGQYDRIFGTNAVQPPQVIPIDTSKPNISNRFAEMQRARSAAIKNR